MTRTVIVGGGISALASAFELQRAGVPYTLIERDTRLGGVIMTHRLEGCTLEAGPDSFISQKPAALELIRELGLADQVIGSNDHLRATFVRRNGKLMPLPEGMLMMIPTKVWPMLKTPLLGWWTKVRMGLEFLRRPYPSPDRSVSEFIEDHYGQEMVDYIAEPLLAGVYGGDPRLLSAVSTLPRFVAFERKYGSLTRGALTEKLSQPKSEGTLFRTLKSGLGSLVEALAPPADSVLLGSPAEAIEQTNGAYRVRRGGDWIECSNVILAGASYEAARLLRPLAKRVADLLDQTGYSSSATVTLGYRKSDLAGSMQGFGVLIPGVERKRMRACTFVANKFSHRVADGFEVIRCFVGGALDEGILNESDSLIVDTVRAELMELLGISAIPVFHQVQRWRKAMAQYTVGHQARVAECMARLKDLPGIHLAGNGYTGIGIPDCIAMGRNAGRAAAGVRGRM